ncbi:MAG: hypothetical protein D6767_00805 [Candidatus Hydrogenedentota bacterium]|nr:MAG: hypothetical protein D6767_00805 [Candidatus Hydrogenedentota bacterium]
MKFLLRNIFLLFTILHIACLGKADPPKLQKKDDSIIGRFIREVGPDEMQKLLNSPEDPNNPGLPVNDLLYMVDKVSIDKMIRLVQGIGASSTLQLMYAIKRLGCGKADPIRFNTTHVGCYTSDYHYLKVAADLLTGTQDVEKIIRLVNRVSIDPAAKFCGPTMNPADEPDCDRYIEKLAFLTVYLNDVSKMTALINGVIDERDVVFFIDQLDTGLSLPPIAATDIAAGNELAENYRLVKIMQNVQDANKLYAMINGKRTSRSTSEDATQQAYLRDKMVPVIQGPTGMTPQSTQENAWIYKLYTMINTIADMSKMVDLLSQISTTTVPTVVSLIDSLNPGTLSSYTASPTAPQDSAMITLAYTVDNTDKIEKLVYLMENADMSKLAPVINDVSCISQASDGGNNNSGLTCSDATADGSRDDLQAAGKKLTAIINGITYTSSTNHKLYRMADLIDALSTTCGTNTLDSAKLSNIINFLSIANSTKLADLINDITNWQGNETTYYDSTARSSAAPAAGWCAFTDANYPPLLNVTFKVNSPTSAAPKDTAVRTLAYVLDNVADSNKMVQLVDEAGNTRATNLATLVNEVACVSQAADGSTNNTDCNTADGTRDDFNAAGKKMVSVIDNVSDITDLEFVIDNVSTISNMAALINQIDIGNGTTTGTARIATIINNVSVEPNAWNTTPNDAATRGTSTGMGKLVNMIEYVNDPSMASMAQLINGIDGNLLGYLILGSNTTAGTTNSSNLVGLVNAILAEPTVSVTDMVNMMTSPYDLASDTTIHSNPAQTYGDILGELVNTLSPATGTTTTNPSADHQLVAQLLAPISGVSQGVGSANMNMLIRDLNSVASGQRTGQLLSQTNSPLCYNENCSSPTLSKREAFVRMILPDIPPNGGVLYTLPNPDVNFPGIGVIHIATLMNDANSATNLITLINNSNIADAIVIVGCTDHVNDYNSDGVKDDPTGPDFYTPCTTIGQGW